MIATVAARGLRDGIEAVTDVTAAETAIPMTAEVMVETTGGGASRAASAERSANAKKS
jgi:hypothetical protein